MSTLRDLLYKETSMYEKYGSTETRALAKKYYDSIIAKAKKKASAGKYFIEVDKVEIPDECIPYFIHLCNEDCLGFEKKVENNREWGFEDVIVYRISWE